MRCFLDRVQLQCSMPGLIHAVGLDACPLRAARATRGNFWCFDWLPSCLSHTDVGRCEGMHIRRYSTAQLGRGTARPMLFQWICPITYTLLTPRSPQRPAEDRRDVCTAGDLCSDVRLSGKQLHFIGHQGSVLALWYKQQRQRRSSGTVMVSNAHAICQTLLWSRQVTKCLMPYLN